MAKYVVMKSRKSGRWLVVEKKYGYVAAKADTREDAVKRMAELKEEDKAKAESKKAHKNDTEKKVEKLVIGKLAEAPDGRMYHLDRNCGLTERSRYCYTLTVDGECIFTSGTVEAAAEYIFK